MSDLKCCLCGKPSVGALRGKKMCYFHLVEATKCTEDSRDHNSVFNVMRKAAIEKSLIEKCPVCNPDGWEREAKRKWV